VSAFRPNEFLNVLDGLIAESVGPRLFWDTAYLWFAEKCSKLLPGLPCQCFYDGDVLQQFLRQSVPLF
jgi:hypothetical protein